MDAWPILDIYVVNVCATILDIQTDDTGASVY